jgi:HPt (histidine-containing phosphotransfer) domain-containing protein
MQTEPPRATLDPSALERLRELDPDGRHGIVRRVLATFDVSLSQMLQQLAAAGTQGGGEAVADLAHKLKSSSAAVGALALAKTCAEVEKRQRNGAPAQLEADVRRLITDGEAALQAVRAILHL